MSLSENGPKNTKKKKVRKPSKKVRKQPNVPRSDESVCCIYCTERWVNSRTRKVPTYIHLFCIRIGLYVHSIDFNGSNQRLLIHRNGYRVQSVLSGFTKRVVSIVPNYANGVSK